MKVARPAKLRCRYWAGPAPRHGDYIVPDGKRARTAFKLLSYRPGRKVKWIMRCERLRISEIPDGATRHSWRWDSRKQPLRSPLLD